MLYDKKKFQQREKLIQKMCINLKLYIKIIKYKSIPNTINILK